MKDLLKIYKDLCSPAKVYLILSFITVILYIISMFHIDEHVVHIESISNGKPVEVTSTHGYTVSGLVITVLYSLLWVYILNHICSLKYGTKIAWILVLLPILLFIGIIVIIITLVGWASFKIGEISLLDRVDKSVNKKVYFEDNSNNDNLIKKNISNNNSSMSTKNQLMSGNNPLMNGNNMMANGNVMGMDSSNQQMTNFK